MEAEQQQEGRIPEWYRPGNEGPLAKQSQYVRYAIGTRTGLQTYDVLTYENQFGSSDVIIRGLLTDVENEPDITSVGWRIIGRADGDSSAEEERLKNFLAYYLLNLS